MFKSLLSSKYTFIGPKIMGLMNRAFSTFDKLRLTTYINITAASMVAEGAHSLGGVGFVLGVTSNLGCAWLDLELHGVTAWVHFYM